MDEAADLQSAIAALWDDARPRLLARVDALATAAEGLFDEPARARAYVEAHTLAGTLGAFGRSNASAAARAAEQAAASGDRTALVTAVRALREAL